MVIRKSTTSDAPKNKKKKYEASVEFVGFREEIELQAYYNYLKRVMNNIPGNELSDWLEAEKSVRSRLSAG